MKSQRIIKVIRIHPLAATIICAKSPENHECLYKMRTNVLMNSCFGLDLSCGPTDCYEQRLKMS